MCGWVMYPLLILFLEREGEVKRKKGRGARKEDTCIHVCVCLDVHNLCVCVCVFYFCSHSCRFQAPLSTEGGISEEDKYLFGGNPIDIQMFSTTKSD